MPDVLFGALLVLALGASMVALWQSRPHRSLARWQEDARTSVERLDRERTAWAAEMEAIRTAVDGVLESVERKRRQTASQASRVATAEEAAPQMDPDNKDHLRAVVGIGG